MTSQWPVVNEAAEYTRRLRERDASLNDLVFSNEHPDHHLSVQRSDNAMLQEFLDAVREHGGSTPVRRLRVSEKLFQFLNASDRFGILIVLDILSSSLPSLEELELEPSRKRTGAWAFMRSIRSSLPRLKRLDVGLSIEFYPVPSEEVGNLLRGAVCLQELRFREFTVNINNEHNEGILSAVVSALARITTLRTLELRTLHANLSNPLVSEGALRMLLRSGSLLDVTLVNIGLNNNAAKAIAQELSGNTSLERIDLSQNRSISEEGLRMICSMMEKQLYITKFRIVCSTLHDYEGRERELTLRSAISSFAKLNASGRRRISQNENADNSEWVELLSAASHNLEALFSLLKLNPKICVRNDSQ
jgi:hypothetical protein